jgi:hypothetical protein
MAIDKLIPQYLNTDSDERYVKSMEMFVARNVRVSPGEAGSGGVLKNVKGNTPINPRSQADAIPTDGFNRVIGEWAVESQGVVYYCLYNSKGNHGIYEYFSQDDKYEKLYEGSNLNFQLNGFVKMDVVINQYGDHLLYFTDNFNEPRKINATKLRNNLYDEYLTQGTNEQKDLYFAAAKKPPLDPPTFQFQTDSGLRYNNLKENVFQFCYTYEYEDGEISALSPISKLAVSDTNLSYNVLARNTFAEENNTLRITVKNAYGDVSKIHVYARKNNEGTFYKIKDLVNQDPQNGGNPTRSFLFRNDGVYTILPNQQRDKLFDAVPLRAGAQTYAGNRIIYGDYEEGFDPVDTGGTFSYPLYKPEDLFASSNLSALTDEEFYNPIVAGLATGNQDRVSALFNRWGSGEIESVAVVHKPIGDGVNEDYPRITIDLTEIPEGILDDSEFAMDITLNCDRFGIGGFDGGAEFTVPITVRDEEVEFEYTNNELVTMIAAAQHVTEGPPYGTYSFDNQIVGQKSITNLVSENGVTFYSQFQVPNGFSTRDQIINHIGQSLVGLTSTTSVNTPFPTQPNVVGIDLPFPDSATTLRPKWPGPQELRDSGGLLTPFPHIELWLAGTIDFIIDSYTIYEEGGRVYLELPVIMTGVNLTARHGRVFPISNSAYYINPMANLEDGTGSFATYYHESDNQISCSIDSSTLNNLGWQVADRKEGSSRVTSAWENFRVAEESVELFSTSSNERLSFKAGATHEIASGYMDNRGKIRSVDRFSSGVNVAHFGEAERYGNNGATHIDLRMMHSPPPWAVRWQPLISKNVTYDSVLQITIAEAFIGGTTTYDDPLSRDDTVERPIIQTLEDSDKSTIYLSLRGLEGKADSYKEFKGGQIDYQFVEGDRLRILQYTDPNGFVKRPLHDFVITGYEYYVDDDKNPIRIIDTSSTDNENDYRRTGWFLKLRDDNIDRFSKNSIANYDDYFSQKCLVEIFRPKKNEDKLSYYPVGRSYPIIEVDGQLTHGGDRPNNGILESTVLITGGTSFTSEDKFWAGDEIVSDNVWLNGKIIIGILVLSDSLYKYTISGAIPDDQLGTEYVISIREDSGSGLLPGVVTIAEGDVYLRARECLVNKLSDHTTGTGTILKYDPTIPKEQTYDKFLIESESVSDFFPSKAVSIGRPRVEIPTEKRIRRYSSFTYSDPFVIDGSRLNLNSFNPSLFPTKDMKSKYGKIDYLFDGGESLVVMQDSKVSQVPIDRQLIESSSDGMLVTSTNVMGVERPYSGDFGPSGSPESVRNYLGRTYFVDRKNQKTVQIGGDGMSVMSDTDMAREIESILSGVAPGQKIPCGYDPLHKEFIMSPIKKIFLIESEGGGDSPTGEELTGVFPSANFTDSTDTVDMDDFSFIDQDDTILSDRGNGVIMLNRLNEDQPAIILDKNLAGVSDDILMIGKDGENRYQVVYNPASGLITLPEGAVLSTPPLALASGPPPTTEETKGDKFIYRGSTLSYFTNGGKWITYYDFIPDLYSNIGNKFLAFSNGQIYLQNSNPSHGTFFGESFPALFGVVSKNNPSDVKVYRALSIEGNARWDVALSNDDQSSIIPSTSLEEKENFWYHDVLRDQSNSTRNIVVLSKLAEPFPDGATEMKFLSRVNNLPFHIGEALFLFNGDQYVDTGLTVSSIVSEKVIGVSGTQTQQIPAGSFIVTIDDSLLSGDNMRGHYMKMILTNDDRTSVEMHAVNLVYDHSPLHNAQVN